MVESSSKFILALSVPLARSISAGVLWLAAYGGKEKRGKRKMEGLQGTFPTKPQWGLDPRLKGGHA